MAVMAKAPRVLKLAYKRLLNRRIDRYQDDMLVIIMYHGICDYCRPNTITPWDFEAGFKSCSFRELIMDEFRPKGRRFIVTFDDAEKCVIEYALPILKKHQMQCCIFASSALLGKSYGFSWAKTPKSIVTLDETKKYGGYRIDHMHADDIKKWLNEGLEIGSHGLWHQDLSSLCLNPESLRCEVEQSKLMLEANFGVDIETFAYPFGSYNQMVKECIKKYHRCAVTLVKGGISRGRPKVDPWELPRITGGNAFKFSCDVSNMIKNRLLKGVDMTE